MDHPAIETKDLTDVFNRAWVQRDEHWEKAAVNEMLIRLVSIVPNSQIDWDTGVPEQWTRVLRDDQVIALILVPAPLLILRADYIGIAQEFPNFVGPIDSSEHWRSQRISVDQPTLEQVFNTKLDNVLDFSSTSMSDLWVATVA